MLWVHRIAWTVLLLWAGFWIWFNVASGIGEMTEIGATGVSINHFLPALIIAAAVGLTGYHPRAGSILLLALAAAAAVFLNVQRSVFLVLALIAPVVLAALLLLARSLRPPRPLHP
jgi:hypothetical protein